MDLVTRVQHLYAAFGRKDLDAVLVGLHPGVVWDHNWSVSPPEAWKPRRGHAEVRRFFADLSAFEMLHFRPMDFLAGKSRVAVPVEIEMRDPATGRCHADTELHLWTFDATPLVIHHRAYVDSIALARMIGALE